MRRIDADEKHHWQCDERKAKHLFQRMVIRVDAVETYDRVMDPVEAPKEADLMLRAMEPVVEAVGDENRQQDRCRCDQKRCSGLDLPIEQRLELPLRMEPSNELEPGIGNQQRDEPEPGTVPVATLRGCSRPEPLGED